MSLISAFRPLSTRPYLRSRRSRLKKTPSQPTQPPVPENHVEDDEYADIQSMIAPSKHTPKAFQKIRGSVSAGGPLRPFRLLHQDVRNIRQRYMSDWTTFNQQIIASAIYVFFTNLLPGITFASDLYVLTGKNWGTIEVIFSTGLCGVVFSLFSIQPLTILGVTGPFSVLAENIYSLCTNSLGIPFLPFMAWSLLHATYLHYILAIFNAHDWTMRYVTTFSTEIFSFLNSIIYFHKAIQELQRAHASLSLAAFFYAVLAASFTMLLAIFLSTAESWRPLFHPHIRTGLAEYAAAISIIVFIALPHIVPELKALDRESLQVSGSFRPTSPERSTFFVDFWTLPVPWIFAAIIPGLIITTLFFFDHEVSSITCTVDRYNTRKPGGFAWDIFLLGTTTGLCGILGIPPANGLLPQAPLHSESLMYISKGDDETSSSPQKPFHRVYEQRWSAFLAAALIFAFISPSFQRVLSLTPTSVLAGLFFFMSEQSLSVNPILYRFFYLLTPSSSLPPLPAGVSSYWPIHGYTLLQIAISIGIFVVTLTKAAPAFPAIIIALVPFRLLVMRKVWHRKTLMFVDAWACRKGRPEEDDEDDGKGQETELQELQVIQGGEFTNETRMMTNENTDTQAMNVTDYAQKSGSGGDDVANGEAKV